jgi:hypothetical protein
MAITDTRNVRRSISSQPARDYNRTLTSLAIYCKKSSAVLEKEQPSPLEVFVGKNKQFHIYICPWFRDSNFYTILALNCKK